MSNLFFVSTCDIYRPFDSGSPVTTDIPCRLVPDMPDGQSAATASALLWTDLLEVGIEVDIRDGCTRTLGENALTYADGDEVRLGDKRYVVVWVETVNRNTPQVRQRVYLMRHAVIRS